MVGVNGSVLGRNLRLSAEHRNTYRGRGSQHDLELTAAALVRNFNSVALRCGSLMEASLDSFRVAQVTKNFASLRISVMSDICFYDGMEFYVHMYHRWKIASLQRIRFSY